MPYVEPDNSKEIAERIVVLAERLLRMKQDFGFSDKDARGAALTNCRIHCFFAGFILNILCMGEESRIAADDFCKMVGLNKGTAQDAADIMTKTARLGFLVLFQFQIENMLNNILRSLGHSVDFGYYKLITTLMTKLSISNAQNKLEVLYLPAMLRNSLHSNGIHRGHKGKSTKIEIDGFTFELNHGKKVSCAGWGHVILAINTSVDIIQEILSTSTVRTLNEPIEDQYTWEIMA